MWEASEFKVTQQTEGTLEPRFVCKGQPIASNTGPPLPIKQGKLRRVSDGEGAGACIPKAHTCPHGHTHHPSSPLSPCTVALVVHTGRPVLHPLGGGPIASAGASRNPYSVHLVGLKCTERKLRLISRHLGGDNLLCWDRKPGCRVAT